MLLDTSKLLREYQVDLGDARRDERVRQSVLRIGAAPDRSFPKQMRSIAEQEAFYRLLRNPRVSMEALLAGHYAETLTRIAQHRVVRIAHDTSEFSFEGDREGLHFREGGRKGSFYAHFALATTADDRREPLGVLGVRPFANTENLDRGLTTAQKSARKKATPREEKKSSRWEKLAIDTDNALPDGVEAIHLMDQEADDFNVFSALLHAGLRFVIRVETKRLTADNIRTSEFLADKPAQFLRSVQVSRRGKKQSSRQHPVRAERKALLSVRASTVTLKRPKGSQATLKEISISAVHVFEECPPSGQPPIEWMLFSSEPVDTLEQIEAVVDHYRGRWIIEEYIKALKTGCAFEKRQLESFDTLVRALALFVPIAWALLMLRTLGREPTNRSALYVFKEHQLRLLHVLLAGQNVKLPDRPTVRDAMLGIAALGGHIKNNGDPGWIVLGRGLQEFFEAERVWLLTREM